MCEIFNFIDDKFYGMDKWIQNLTYISVLLLFILTVLVTFLIPKFIDIRLVGTKNNKEFPLAEAKTAIEVRNRLIKMVTDANGYFSLPLGIMLNPFWRYTFVLSPTSGTKSEIEIKIRGYKAYFGRNKLIYHKGRKTGVKYEFS